METTIHTYIHKMSCLLSDGIFSQLIENSLFCSDCDSASKSSVCINFRLVPRPITMYVCMYVCMYVVCVCMH